MEREIPKRSYVQNLYKNEGKRLRENVGQWPRNMDNKTEKLVISKPGCNISLLCFSILTIEVNVERKRNT